MQYSEDHTCHQYTNDNRQSGQCHGARQCMEKRSYSQFIKDLKQILHTIKAKILKTMHVLDISKTRHVLDISKTIDMSWIYRRQDMFWIY